MRLTKRLVDAQEASDKDAYIWDGDLKGFGVKVTPKGRKVYLTQYRMAGRNSRTQRYTLGAHGQLTTDEARKLAKRKLGDVAAGRDPAAERDQKRIEKKVSSLIDRFMHEYALKKFKPSTVEGYERVFRIHLKPHFRARLVTEITHNDVVRFHNGLEKAPYFANRALAVFSKFFSWCEKHGYRPMNSNPCKYVDRYKEKPRARYLNLDEQLRLGDALRQAKAEELATPYAITAIRLLSLTGARLSEVLNLE